MWQRISNHASGLLLTIGAFAISAAVVSAAGALVLPDQTPQPSNTGFTTPTIDDLIGSQAIVVLSGDDEGRYELKRLTVNEWNETISSQDPLSLSLTFRSNDLSLLIGATRVTVDAPATGQAASAVIGVEGANYFANNGECTIALDEVDFTVLEPQPAVRDGVPRGVPIPTYAGTVQCTAIEEVGSDRLIDIYGVFRHQPQE